MQKQFLRKLLNGVIDGQFKKNKKPLTPRQQLEDLFDDVQCSRTFADSKTFVDAVPNQSIKKIRKEYKNKNKQQVDIAQFVDRNFTLPRSVALSVTHNIQPIESVSVRDYIESMWGVLVRSPNDVFVHSSVLPLPHRFVVPGGRFSETYYWDAYFTLLGLKESGHTDLIESMVQNFAHLIQSYGYIPNGNRSYYLGRSHPPVFALMVELLAEVKGEQVFVEYATDMLKEYEFWMRGVKNIQRKKAEQHSAQHVVKMPDGELLNRYWDESDTPREESFVEDIDLGVRLLDPAHFYRNIRAGAESGWDFSSRWLKDASRLDSIRTTDIVPIDLNIFLLKMEEIISYTYQLQNKHTLADTFDELVTNRREAIQKYLWNEKEGWFTDYLWTESKQLAQQTIAGAFALYGGVATTNQATRIVQTIETQFLKTGGVATTHVRSGQQWDAPNGWAPLQYITIQGLERYGESELAHEIASRWCSLNISQYKETGQLYEKYDIEHTNDLATGGEYEVQTGFGWTNGVLLALMNQYHIEE